MVQKITSNRAPSFYQGQNKTNIFEITCIFYLGNIQTWSPGWTQIQSKNGTFSAILRKNFVKSHRQRSLLSLLLLYLVFC